MRRGCWWLRWLPLAALLSLCAAFCPPRCRCDDVALVADCTGAELDSFPITLNPRLRRLELSGNAIRRVDASMVSIYMELQYLDLSNNGVMSVQAGSFAYQSRLQELVLSNNELAELDPQVFRGLEQLQVLDISNNLLQHLPPNVLTNTPVLQDLNLSGNRLTALTVSGFRGAVNLRRVNLSDNQFSELPTEALASLAQLDTLDLAGNSITRLGSGELARAGPSLADLNLAGNQFFSLDQHSFYGLNSLRRLVLADTGLVEAEGAVFSYLQRLEELYLGGNPFSRIGPTSFQNLHRLRLLSIRACRSFNTIEPETFAANVALQTVRIEENPNLTEIPEELFLRLPLLRQLSLHANALASLPYSAASWQNLQTDLSGNPWHCDCRLGWLLELPAVVNISGAVCVSPPELQGRAARLLNLDDLLCSDDDVSTVALTVGVTVGVVLIVAALLGCVCYRYRQRLRKMLKVFTWRDRVNVKRKESYHPATTYFCHDVYDPVHHQRDSRLVPVTEL